MGGISLLPPPHHAQSFITSPLEIPKVRNTGETNHIQTMALSLPERQSVVFSRYGELKIVSVFYMRGTILQNIVTYIVTYIV